MGEAQSVGKRRSHLGEQAWRELFDRFDSARLSVDAFCRREGLCRSSFNRWRARLRPEGRGVALPKRGATPASSPPFVDLGMLGAATGSAVPTAAVPASAVELRIELGDGITLTLSRR
jgi:hypothetical protein